MSHRDGCRGSRLSAGVQDLMQVLDSVLGEVDFRGLTSPQQSCWSLRGLVRMALLWVWSEESTLTGRFASVLQIAIRLWPDDVRQPISYQAFLKRLVCWTDRLRGPLQHALRGVMQRSLKAHWRIAGRCVFGVDGSKLELARTRSNEGRFSPAAARTGQSTRRSGRSSRQSSRSRHKKADSPQLWLTTLWHAGTGLVWDWRLGPADSSEREHLRQMLDSLPPHALLTADAGFVGYEVWSTILARGHDLLIRVGGNVRLLKRLGFARESQGTVYLWPDEAARRGRPPLVLRLVVVQGARHPWHLVTSVHNSRQLSDRQIVEIYRRRWGIELFYRHFKQTFSRRKLRSHAADHVLCEAHWSLIGLWVLLLHAEQQLHQQHIPPRRMSVAKVLRAYRQLLKRPCATCQPPPRLTEMLAAATLDDYSRRNKQSRNYPQKKYTAPCGPPAIHAATRQQQQLATQLRELNDKGLTA